MTFNPELAQIGDICCYRAKITDPLGQAIGILSDPFHPFREKISHVSIVSEILPDGTIKIIESHLWNTNDQGNHVSGVIEKTLNPKWFDKITLVRYRFELSDLQKIELIKQMKKNVVGRDYDAASFLSKFIRNLILPKETPLLNDKGAFDCAETITYSYMKFLYINLTPRVNIHTASPMSIRYSKEVKVIS